MASAKKIILPNGSIQILNNFCGICQKKVDLKSTKIVAPCYCNTPVHVTCLNHSIMDSGICFNCYHTIDFIKFKNFSVGNLFGMITILIFFCLLICMLTSMFLDITLNISIFNFFLSIILFIFISMTCDNIPLNETLYSMIGYENKIIYKDIRVGYIHE